MSEILCDSCDTEGDHPARIICEACFDSMQTKARCCINTQAENAKLKEELERHRWVPVSERLPGNIDHDVLVTDGDSIWVAWYYPSARRWAQVKPIQGNITHWKPIILPE